MSLGNDLIIKLLLDLISSEAVTESEERALKVLEDFINSYFRNLTVVKIPVTENRYSLLFYKDKPSIILTTHIDVVPASKNLFSARLVDDHIYGRGSLDAQGILVSMVGAFYDLLENNNAEVGLLVVVGEETNGIGALKSSEELKKYDLNFLINGEPTEFKLATGHKGIIDFIISFTGRNAHSGYPELGEDANEKLLYSLSEILKLPRDYDSRFGETTINIGKIVAGTASNIISDSAYAKCCIRLASNKNLEFQDRIKEIVAKGDFIVNTSYDPISLKVLPGYETIQVCYGTDVPNFSGINSSRVNKCEFLLYGPGNIIRAHTDSEYITKPELIRAREEYKKICLELINQTI